MMRRLTLTAMALLLCLVAGPAGADIDNPSDGSASIPGVASIYATSTGTGNDFSTYLLLDCEDDISDRSAYQRGDPDVESATVSAAQKKFGSESCAFDGSQSFEWTNEPLWHLTGDFTFDAWLRFDTLPADGTYQTIYAWNTASPYDDLTSLLFWGEDDGGMKYYLWVYIKRGGGSVVDFKREVTVAVDTWYHVAETRDGNNYRVFWDGTQAGATETDASATPDFDGRFTVGEYYRGAAVGYFDGYMDEIRLSVGLARWTANFSVPTAAYGHLALFITDDEGSIYPLVQPWGY